MWYIVYSDQAAQQFGFNIYVTTDRKEVRGTAIYQDLEWYQKEYCWPDKEIVGTMTECKIKYFNLFKSKL